MELNDKRPLANTPVTQRISSIADNRLGAVYSALYSFWSARANATSRTGGLRRDAYSVIMFDDTPQTCLESDVDMDAEELLNVMLRHSVGGFTDFDAALASAQAIMERHWHPIR